MGLAERTLIRVVTWSLVPVLAAGIVAVDLWGTPVPGPRLADLPLIVATLACWLVGVVVTGRASSQPAGWAFLGLGTALAWSAFTDVYAPPPDSGVDRLPAYELVAALGDTSFVWWFVFLALVLQYTPSRPRSGLAVRLPAVTVAAGLVFQVSGLLRTSRLDPPREELVSPLAVDALRVPAAALAAISVYLLVVCLLLSVALLVRAWRRSAGESRRQLLWLVAGAVPVPPVVITAFAVSWAGNTTVAGAVLAIGIACLVLGAGFSVLRYRLYNVERVVTESAAYAVACVSVICIFILVIVVIGRSTPIEADSQLPVVAATLAGVATARASFVWARRAAGRGINRTRFVAVEAIRSGLADPAPDLDSLVTTALGSRARLVYPAAGGVWVTAQGHEARAGAAHVDICRHGKLTGRVEYDPEMTDREVVEAVAAAAAPEVDNVALRAELARQVEVVTESRARLAAALMAERRRIERDLHDGAQQRLLAIALQLQAARVNGDSAVLTREIDRAVIDLGTTVQELRDIAAGLQPAALAGGGLLAAVEDLAGRIPLRVGYDVVDRRFPARIEAAAWFVIAEAMANVVKHAQTGEAGITVTASGSVLHVLVTDQGVGGADVRGRGLAGLADRVTALGGTLSVGELEPRGTVVEAVLPCGS